jgi:hypothetical protein
MLIATITTEYTNKHQLHKFTTMDLSKRSTSRTNFSWDVKRERNNVNKERKRYIIKEILII